MPTTETRAARARITLLHTSDLHIGSDVYAAEAFQGFEAALEIGIERRANAVLIAGDLFDNGRVEQGVMAKVWGAMADLAVPVVVLPGNHDTVLLNNDGLGSAPANVTVMRRPQGETVSIPELDLAVWGKPVYDHLPGFRPMADVPPISGDRWYIGMAHGLYMDPPDPMRASPISPQEIATAPCDYVALGHVHVFRDVSQNEVPAFYSGAPSGSQTNTVAMVELDPTAGVIVSPVEITPE